MKMKWLVQRNIPLVRISARSVTFYRSTTWQTWLRYGFRTHVAPLAAAPRDARKRIVLEDSARYRAFYDECMANDELLRPHAVFVSVAEACEAAEQS